MRDTFLGIAACSSMNATIVQNATVNTINMITFKVIWVCVNSNSLFYPRCFSTYQLSTFVFTFLSTMIIFCFLYTSVIFRQIIISIQLVGESVRARGQRRRSNWRRRRTKKRKIENSHHDFFLELSLLELALYSLVESRESYCRVERELLSTTPVELSRESRERVGTVSCLDRTRVPSVRTLQYSPVQ